MVVGLIYLLFGLALWHFVVEAIIVPSARATIRLRLFALRDRLRGLCMQGKIGPKEFEEAQSRINNLIRLIPILDTYTLVTWDSKMKSDKDLAKRIEKRQVEFEEIASQDVKSIIKDACEIGFEALRINSLGWAVYLIPIAIGTSIFRPQKIMKVATATELELPSPTHCPA